MSLKDRRKHLRKPADLSVQFNVCGKADRSSGRCTSLSLGGMFVQVSPVPDFGAKLDVSLSIPGYPGQFEVEATVRWTVSDGAGVQFGLMGAKQTYALTEYLATLEDGPPSVRLA